MIRLTIVSPCYNEEDVLAISAKKISVVLNDLILKDKISNDSCWLCVNDGSRDETWNIIQELHKKNPAIKGINLANNVGHQRAIMAGMMTAKEWSDAIITMDADLQDDINCIEQMVDAYNEGYEIVYGVKVSRKADPILKRLSAMAFYKLQSSMGVDCVYNHADFRLMSKRALNILAEFDERNLYLRGLIPLIGLKNTTIDDVISEREAGSSKYTLRKMLNLAIDGITSFSAKPIEGIIYIGLFFLIISSFITIYVLYGLLAGQAIAGWASIMLSIWFVGGVLLICIGIIGVYIGKIFEEVKHRPLYNIQDII